MENLKGIEQYLQTCLVEECAESIKEVTKTFRFGSEPVDYKGKHYDHVKSLEEELADVIGVVTLMHYHDMVDMDRILTLVEPAMIKKIDRYGISKFNNGAQSDGAKLLNIPNDLTRKLVAQFKETRSKMKGGNDE